MRSSWWIALAVLVAAGCQRQYEPGLYVTVELARGLQSKSVRVLAKGDGLTRPSNCMVIGNRTTLRVGLVQADLPSVITLEAAGYSDDACATLADPPEAAAPREARFRPGVVLEATLTLRRATPSQETTCDNGIDDDLDGDTDCADFDCNARTCTNGNKCVTGLTCQGGQCLGGTQVVCDAPPSPCFMGAGICVVDAGCRYPPNAGVACDDSDDCTTMDTCRLDGTCSGTPKPCTTPPGQCFMGTGTCVTDAGCQYAPTPNATCDDGDECTVDDRCDAVGGCAGTAVTCGPRECQRFAGACDADGGCRYEPVDAGTPCSGGGVCNATGGCVPMWTYTPSNFPLTQVPSLPDAGVVLDCGETVIDTSGSAPTVTNWCPGQPLFGWGILPQDGGVEAMIFSFRDLDVMADGGLTVKGTRPAIIAAAGRVRVLGGVTVEAGAQACASGGRGASPSSGNGGAGGGGFGSPGGAGGDGLGSGGPGGGTSGTPLLVPLRGGCPGGVGGGNGTRAASGGGALQISANGDLIISGHVAAPGQGGSGGGLGAGGNGAGSGGAVLLEGLQIVLVGTAAVTANGGGGGKAGLVARGDDGAPGSPTTSTPAPGATGGNIGTGSGGDGAAGSTPAANGNAGTLGAAGGGGGGGVGRVRLNSALGCSIGPQTVVSPAATSNTPDAGCP
ncbi:MAG: hypothetical protein AB1730_27625 [Myxococcota bacterium]